MKIVKINDEFKNENIVTFCTYYWYNNKLYITNNENVGLEWIEIEKQWVPDESINIKNLKINGMKLQEIQVKKILVKTNFEPLGIYYLVIDNEQYPGYFYQATNDESDYSEDFELCNELFDNFKFLDIEYFPEYIILQIKSTETN